MKKCIMSDKVVEKMVKKELNEIQKIERTNQNGVLNYTHQFVYFKYLNNQCLCIRH